jgi:hypothetical protein
MCFDRNVNENKDAKILGCDYCVLCIYVQWCVKLTLVLLPSNSQQSSILLNISPELNGTETAEGPKSFEGGV